MLGWNLLFPDRQPAGDVGGQWGPRWQRGRYLVDVLGHCGECHTPRGPLGEMELPRSLKGFALAASRHPTSRRPASLGAAGRRPVSARISSRGIAGPNSAFADMHQVVVLSTRNLTADDIAAMTTYLLGDKPPLACSRDGGRGQPGRTDQLRRAVRRLPWSRRQGHSQHHRGVAQQQHAQARRSAQPDRGDAGRHRPAELPASHELCPACRASPTSSATSRPPPW